MLATHETEPIDGAKDQESASGKTPGNRGGRGAVVIALIITSAALVGCTLVFMALTSVLGT
jgi:hypothetical protein